MPEQSLWRWILERLGFPTLVCAVMFVAFGKYNTQVREDRQLERKDFVQALDKTQKTHAEERREMMKTLDGLGVLLTQVRDQLASTKGEGGSRTTRRSH